MSFNPHAWGLFLQVVLGELKSSLYCRTFNPHAWGLFLQVLRYTSYVYDDRDSLSIPMLGDSFCKLDAWAAWIEKQCLSIPMLGDSFCKLETGEGWFGVHTDFQSPCLGTLFARLLCAVNEVLKLLTFNPHAWGLFLQDFTFSTISSCSSVSFNPHAWGLFLQGVYTVRFYKVDHRAFNPHAWGLFLQARDGLAPPGSLRAFNPHAWGLFLQASSVSSRVTVTFPSFQSPCLGTLFASISKLAEEYRRIVFQSPCLGTLFARPVRRLPHK